MNSNSDQKYLIPCYKDMKILNLPNELKVYQCQDLNKLAYMHDLIKEIDKIFDKDIEESDTNIYTYTYNSENVQGIIEMLLSEGDFTKASELVEDLLNNDYQNAKAYIYLLMIQLKIRKEIDLANSKDPLSNYKNFKMVVKLVTPEYKETLLAYNSASSRTYFENIKLKKYNNALFLSETKSYDAYKSAIKLVKEIIDYKDSKELVIKYENECKKFEERKKKKSVYLWSTIGVFVLTILILVVVIIVPKDKLREAKNLIETGNYEKELEIIEDLGNYKDAENQYSMIEAYKAFDENNFLGGINYILKIGREVTIKYNVNDGYIKKETEVIKNINDINYSPIREDYEFVKWNQTNFEIVNVENAYKAEVNLEAEWERIYHVKYYLYGGTCEDLQYDFKKDDKFDLPIQKRKGYLICEWYNAKDKLIEELYNADITLYAKWLECKVINNTIHFGSFPQTKVIDQDTIDILKKPIHIMKEVILFTMA